MLKKYNRLTKNNEFAKVNKGGKAVYSPVLMIKFIKNDLPESRVGIIVSNKVSKKAVLRNTARRRIREILRLNFSKIKTGYDIVVIASPKIIGADGKVIKSQEISGFLLKTLANARLL